MTGTDSRRVFSSTAPVPTTISSPPHHPPRHLPRPLMSTPTAVPNTPLDLSAAVGSPCSSPEHIHLLVSVILLSAIVICSTFTRLRLFFLCPHYLLRLRFNKGRYALFSLSFFLCRLPTKKPPIYRAIQWRLPLPPSFFHVHLNWIRPVCKMSILFQINPVPSCLPKSSLLFWIALNTTGHSCHPAYLAAYLLRCLSVCLSLSIYILYSPAPLLALPRQCLKTAYRLCHSQTVHL
ncbi:hypothetical protein B0H19DRAFT_1201414 [Mycena capillaripes]|nr:hypothetical protein B0H19DRAFT_1201414 [Mycena capillaripes]